MRSGIGRTLDEEENAPLSDRAALDLGYAERNQATAARVSRRPANDGAQSTRNRAGRDEDTDALGQVLRCQPSRA